MVMVGDVINDSLAFVSADVGMTIDVADIILMKSNLEDVITAIDLFRKTFFRIRLN